MRYHLISNDTDQREHWVNTLRDQGFDIVDEYDSNAIIVTLGGDGTVLYAARTFSDPTILPVRTGGSKGYKTRIESSQLVGTLENLEASDKATYPCTTYRKIAAYQDGVQLQGGFDALNEISIHHSTPTLATVLSLQIREQNGHHQFERITGDGVVVSTSFGSTGYYRSITGGSFSCGLGIAFNNVHGPVETPAYLVVSADAVVEIQLAETRHASGAVITRDNVETMYELRVGESVEIRQSDESVEILDPNAVDNR